MLNALPTSQKEPRWLLQQLLSRLLLHQYPWKLPSFDLHQHRLMLYSCLKEDLPRWHSVLGETFCSSIAWISDTFCDGWRIFLPGVFVVKLMSWRWLDSPPAYKPVQNDAVSNKWRHSSLGEVTNHLTGHCMTCNKRIVVFIESQVMFIVPLQSILRLLWDLFSLTTFVFYGYSTILDSFYIPSILKQVVSIIIYCYCVSGGIHKLYKSTERLVIEKALIRYKHVYTDNMNNIFQLLYHRIRDNIDPDKINIE
jgi:hypothetical protein